MKARPALPPPLELLLSVMVIPSLSLMPTETAATLDGSAMVANAPLTSDVVPLMFPR